MRIESVEPFGAEQLLAALARTRLRGFGRPRVYESADLRLAPATDTDTLVPAQNYVLRRGVRTILELREALLAHRLDLFALDGGAYVRTGDDPDQAVPVIPPIVEQSREPDGRTVLIINDGLHRVFAARSLGLPITVVVASDVPEEYPYYAYPLPGGWSDVVELDELPDTHQKKNYRRPDDYKALFRDFNEVFPGVQQQRKRSNPAHLVASGGSTA
jgi:hypothetical protein